MMTMSTLELCAELYIAELRRKAELAHVAAQLEPRASSTVTSIRNALRRLASTPEFSVSTDDVPAWPTLRNYPYGPALEWEWWNRH